jgi:hypothetical protein
MTRLFTSEEVLVVRGLDAEDVRAISDVMAMEDPGRGN